MQVTRLLVVHDCPISRPVARAERARVTHLCHRGEEAILEVHADASSELVSLVEEYKAVGGEVLYQDHEGTAALVRFDQCACCRSGLVIPTIESQGHLYLPPSRYGSEGETYQFLVPEERLDSHLLEKLPPSVRVVRTGTEPLTSLGFEGGFLVPVGILLRDLTDRQRRAIVTAILRGYYRIPRRIKTEELAKSFGISRPAFEALLRKAENKLVAALFPYLTLPGVSEGSPPPSEARTKGS